MGVIAVLAIVLVLLAAATEALSNVFQHKAAQSAGPNGATETRGEFGALLRTLRMPMFLLGFLLMVVGYGFHVASLGLGNLSIIQVIFVSQLVFVLPFTRWVTGMSVSRRDWVGAVVVTIGIALFVSFAQPTEGAMNQSTAQWLGAVAIISIACALAIAGGYRTTGGPRAALIGCSGGFINGLVAPLTKGTIAIGAGGIGAIFANWMIYATLVAVLLGVLFPLMAYRAGPITASFPAVISLNPIVATLLGMWLFHETLAGGFAHVAVMTCAAVAMFIGIVWLSRSPAIAAAFEEPVVEPMP